MDQPTDVSQPHYSLQRKHPRFKLRYPVHVKFRSGSLAGELDAISKNVSVGGVLLEAESPIPQHCEVTFLMKVHGEHIVRPIQLAGEGEVVRVEPVESGEGFAIAVQCRRPITELRYLWKNPS
jgi:hypothetical protein